MRSVETILQILTFDFSWAQDMQYTLSHDAGQWHWATTHSQSNHHKGKQPIHLTTILYHAAILFFTFGAVFDKLYEIFNVLLQNRLCVR